MREMEVKFRVDDLEGLLAALKARGIEVSDPLRQDDQACLESISKNKSRPPDFSVPIPCPAGSTQPIRISSTLSAAT